jgi:hypothetical protein
MRFQAVIVFAALYTLGSVQADFQPNDDEAFALIQYKTGTKDFIFAAAPSVSPNEIRNADS